VTTVATTYGTLRGAELDGIHAFKGIPFAAPPVGPLRFRAPQPPARWDDVRDATAHGPASLQAESPAAQLLAITVAETSEDCLYLNVWTPSLEGRRPVMVWIHGGAFVIGAGSQDLYAGEALARRGDVVVVTINYRLGVFGFLHGKTVPGSSLDATGNEAILDQVAALQWVRDEIAAFGGDPGNVTVFGESAGSISVAALLGMPAARGLFHKAILESGSANLIRGTEAARPVTEMILDHFRLSAGEAGRLRDVPAADLLAAQNEATPRTGGVSYSPVIDGDVIPRSPFEAVAAGETRGIPILIGSTADEMKLFAFMDPSIFQIDEAGLPGRVDVLTGGRGAETVGAYRAAREARGEPVTPFEIYEAIATDLTMRVPAMRLAALQASHTPDVYAYLFTHQSPMAGGVLGACHAIDLPFVFSTYGLEAMKALVGEGPEIEALSGRVMDAWVAFARTGNPSHEGLPRWPAYEPGRRATMLLGPECAVVDAPKELERAFWG
jgi:para-nitrobenzyl esterase